MSNETKTNRTLTGDEIESVAADFENRDFTPNELTKIKRTRRRSPRIGEARAEVYTFRAPPSYKSRIKQRAASDDKT
ncbi:hypothetical protein [Candidatus Poriferisocius sp.]|uniref:hypothetical protein n=1 Tax=Candidatus Poriferisocius sp. TaxID=3101276 RepID=UPI003B51F522